MKRILIILLFSFASFNLSAQAITVTCPAAGIDIERGAIITITWTSTGCTDPNIKINIFRNSIDVSNFVEQLTGPNSGTYTWTVPAGYTPGNYQIRVKTADNACVGDSGVFTISEPAFTSTGSITVNNPAPGTSIMTTQWALGINWSSTGETHARVSIEVIPEGSASGTVIIADTPNDGDFEWRDPAALTGTGRFFVRVRTLDRAVYGDSSVYQVNALPIPESTILVMSPDSSEEWNVGSPRMINWRKSGEMDDRVSIKLFSSPGGVLITTISADTANDESEHWVVPAHFAAGRYIIRIATLDNLVTDDSDVFNITRPGDDPRTPITEEETPPGDPRTPYVPGNKIKIKSPIAGAIWREGQNTDIIWVKCPSVDSKVKIELFKEGVLRAVHVIAANTDNDGVFNWKIPLATPSARYVIKITTLNHAATGTSAIFTINNRTLLRRTK